MSLIFKDSPDCSFRFFFFFYIYLQCSSLKIRIWKMIGELESLKYIQQCSNISHSESLFLPISKDASLIVVLFYPLCFLFKEYPPYAKPLRPAPGLHWRGFPMLVICRRSGGEGTIWNDQSWNHFTVIKTSLWVITVLSSHEIKIKDKLNKK